MKTRTSLPLAPHCAAISFIGSGTAKPGVGIRVPAQDWNPAQPAQQSSRERSMTKSLYTVALASCLMAACSKPATPTAAASVPAEVSAASPAAMPAAIMGGVPARLCAVLRGQVPEVKDMSGIGARSQLVMAIATAFDANATALATVSSDIDAIASAGCAEVRAPLLAATRAESLQEAVR